MKTFEYIHALSKSCSLETANSKITSAIPAAGGSVKLAATDSRECRAFTMICFALNKASSLRTIHNAEGQNKHTLEPVNYSAHISPSSVRRMTQTLAQEVAAIAGELSSVAEQVRNIVLHRAASWPILRSPGQAKSPSKTQ